LESKAYFYRNTLARFNNIVRCNLTFVERLMQVLRAQSRLTAMRFEWPNLLWLFVLLPVLAAFYWYALRRKRKEAIAYSSLSLLKEAMGRRQGLRRHLPPLLLGLALIPLILAIARPSTTFTLPSDQVTIVLAMDVSLSMRATDMKPNRISAAKDAAKAFVAELPRSIKVGIVAFAGTATVVQTPTDNRDDLVAAIDAFQLQRGTATGSALMVALNLLRPDSGIDLESALFGKDFRRGPDSQSFLGDTSSKGIAGRGGATGPKRPGSEEIGKPAGSVKEFIPVAPGSYDNGAIILLSDGRRTTGVDPVVAAKYAADRGVKVFTVGFGSKDPNANANDEWSYYLRLDEDALKQMATITKADYQHAGSSADLRKVYQGFNTKFSMERRETEVSALFSALAALLVLVAAFLSLRWLRGV
jgi:Ca-activated chloride channel homolog